MSILTALRISYQTVPGFAAVGFMWGCVAAMAPVLKARIGVDDATFGLLLLGTACGLTVTMFTAARWDSALGRWAMPLATVMLAGAALLPGQASAPWMLFGALAVAGMASGLLDVVMNARVSAREGITGQSLMNANHAMFSAAYAASAFATGWLREAEWSPEAIFAVIALLILLTAPFQFDPGEPERPEGETPSRLPMGLVAVFGTLVMVAFMTEATVESWSALHIERTLNGDAAEGAFGPTMLGVTMAFGRFSGQAVAARLSEEAVIRWATLVSMAGALVAAVAPAPAIAYLGFGLMGLGVSVIGPMGLALAGRLAPRDRRTAVIARVALIAFLGFFIAPALMGLGAQGVGLRWAFASVALFVASEFVLLRLAKRVGSLPVQSLHRPTA